jgi:hypothetical protein
MRKGVKKVEPKKTEQNIKPKLNPKGFGTTF